MQEHTQWLNGNTASRDDARFAELYAELKKIALGRMAIEGNGKALEATELVHEAWLRLQKSTPEHWRDRGQFYGAAAEAMRRILIETARRRLSAKRGGGEADLALEAMQLQTPLPDERLIGIHEVLDQLEAEDALKAKIVKLRFFSGMNHDEIAVLLEVNEKTIRRHWALAKLWLYRAMEKNR